MTRFEVYQDRANQWRWRFITNNGRIIADSAEGYVSRQDCVNGIDLIKQQAPTALVV